MALNPDFRDLFAALNAAGARYLLVGGYAVAFHAPPNRIDIVTAIDGVGFAEAWADRAQTSYGGEAVPVISRRHLIQNKRACGRPQDLLDVTMLEQD